MSKGAFVWFLYQLLGQSESPPARHDRGSDGGGTAGCWHDPAGRVQVAEVHDCFTIVELMMLRRGWAEQGQGIDLVLSGRTSIEEISRSIQVEVWWVSGIL